MTEPPLTDTNASRFTWEAFIRGARLADVIPAQGKRGAVSAATFKAIALVWASYADPDGTNVFPGVATVAVAAEVSFKTAKLVTAKLVELGLLKRVAATTRRARRYDLYRLALPEDILEHVTHLNPDQMAKAGEAMRLAYRGRPKTCSVGGTTDPLPGLDDDAPDGSDDGIGVGSGGPPGSFGVGSSGPAVGGPADRGTYPGTVPSISTEPSTVADLDLSVTVDAANKDQIDSSVVNVPPESKPSTDAGPCPYPKCDGSTYQVGVGSGRYRRKCPDSRHKN